MFSSDSILWWLIKTYHKVQERYEKAMVDPNLSHLNFIRLKSRKEVRDFLASV